jgi:group I intron endonuclease
MLIYKITNLIHGRVYIGQTIQTNPKMRWYSHQSDARHGKKSHLYDSMRKHGVENFSWEIIDQAKSVEELNELESKWLAHYRSVSEVYNNREAGNNKLHSAESIERMKEAQRKAHARRRAENGGVETMKRVLKTYGWTHSEESKLKRKEWSAITNKLKAKPLTDEHKRKVSKAIKQSWAKRKALQGVN